MFIVHRNPHPTSAIWLAVIKLYDLRLFSTLDFIAPFNSLGVFSARRGSGIGIAMIIMGVLRERESFTPNHI